MLPKKACKGRGLRQVGSFAQPIERIVADEKMKRRYCPESESFTQRTDPSGTGFREKKKKKKKKKKKTPGHYAEAAKAAKAAEQDTAEEREALPSLFVSQDEEDSNGAENVCSPNIFNIDGSLQYAGEHEQQAPAPKGKRKITELQKGLASRGEETNKGTRATGDERSVPISEKREVSLGADLQRSRSKKIVSALQPHSRARICIDQRSLPVSKSTNGQSRNESLRRDSREIHGDRVRPREKLNDITHMYQHAVAPHDVCSFRARAAPK
ncbi:hypothetical protein MBM_08699 [Drepanopeziza brunnea f. sp. 'multigermtubi' MB_m1]|uniref:Uncharacterized protein n=1 Tax=Marssonina brunnea f. sp. multigermtubi (strain MB_m1) TaxID=1072389 RepID=K1WK69_MARBU|nr:uncharacterized protein MBM_08699 [Drepanopeziza brunnea f. sp. 'multigermtubi' MB_m1]EKD13256.1 hypothetical protein MBM_08699 [Drepanopeziza brunnea f. sp. 'multigermtubi' MB_m1]